MLSTSLRLLIVVAVSALSALLQWRLAAGAAALATLVFSWRQPQLPRWQRLSAAACGLAVLAWCSGVTARWGPPLWQTLQQREALLSDVAQLTIAALALLITLRQFAIERVIIKELNLITQAQLVDNFIQGISEMVSDGDGFLEDWPLERMLAEGRLSAVFGSIDRDGKARVLRFLSHAKLLTPLKRDYRLGRAILDGEGSYAEDRAAGVPVIRLQQLLKGVDLSGTDLRGVDFNGADLRGADLSFCDLTGANLAGTNMAGTNLEQTRLEDCRFFYGRPQTASPRLGSAPFDLTTGAGTGAVVENINLSGARLLDAQNHHYLASWSGARSRATIPGGCKGIPSQLGHPMGS